jgi:hypothetical protein
VCTPTRVPYMYPPPSVRHQAFTHKGLRLSNAYVARMLDADSLEPTYKGLESFVGTGQPANTVETSNDVCVAARLLYQNHRTC